MILESIILIVLSVLAIISAIITITHKEPIKSALALIFHFFMLAGVYITLSAQFLAIMQIVVYAGAIMVLVLFVIMLLSNFDNDDEAQKRKNKIKQSFAITISIAMLILIFSAILFANNAIDNTNNNTIMSSNIGSVEAVGKELYSKFLFPLEIVGILLLSAIIGAVMLAKKKL
jgi:NADH-quinone oxidoreductase subunit J